jgi:hypothetical protein
MQACNSTGKLTSKENLDVVLVLVEGVVEGVLDDETLAHQNKQGKHCK